MRSVRGELTKNGITTEDGHDLIIITMSEIKNKRHGKAQGYCRKGKGTKKFHFVVKPWGEVLLVM